MRKLIIFLIYISLEIYSIMLAGATIGFIPTIFLILAMGCAGFSVFKNCIHAVNVPLNNLLKYFVIACLLIVPGFFSDIIALIVWLSIYIQALDPVFIFNKFFKINPSKEAFKFYEMFGGKAPINQEAENNQKSYTNEQESPYKPYEQASTKPQEFNAEKARSAHNHFRDPSKIIIKEGQFEEIETNANEETRKKQSSNNKNINDKSNS